MGVSVNKIVRLQYRGGGWPGGIRVLLNEGQQKFLPNQASLWSEIFGAYFFVPFCCTVCHDHLNEFADISFADAWLPEIMKNDKVGTSIAITRTRTGEDLLEAARSSGEIELFALSKEDVIQSQLWPLLFKKRNIRARLRFLKIFGRHVPKNLRQNMDAFVNTTLWDYIAAPIPYMNILISRNALFRNILHHMPLKILSFYRQKFKQCLLHDSEQAIKNGKRAKSTASIKILITNSHSNNRGDEAAQRSMIGSLKTLVPDTKFTVLTASPKGLQLPKDVRVLRFFHLSKRTAPFIILWIILRSLGIRLPTFDRISELFQTLEEMASANVVISAPGGPYFGELYASHEIQHLLHIYLAKILRKPVMIYGPSIGPFESRWRNIIRKHILNKVEIITVRDHISKQYLDNLNLTRPFSYLTADSAFQDPISLDRDELRNILVSEEIIDSQNDDVSKRLLVGITPAGASWNYRNSTNPHKEQERYNKIMAKTIDYLVDRFEGTIVFFPQLYGMSDDMPLITEIIRLVNNQGAVKVISKDLNSEIQQALISQMDLVIGNRYHSVVFALKGGVPAICLAYEHKSIGVMEAVKLDRFVIKISDLTYETLAAKIDQVLLQKEEIRSLLKSRIDAIRRRSLVNSILAMALVNCAMRHSTERKDLKKEMDKLMLQFQEGKLPLTDD